MNIDCVHIAIEVYVEDLRVQLLVVGMENPVIEYSAGLFRVKYSSWGLVVLYLLLGCYKEQMWKCVSGLIAVMGFILSKSSSSVLL